ncbi:restriction endonuclease subunit S [Cyanothece sp. BG0011]|uniref:restriction endonuclease subunit S n=1 Tax=Cyanothece sp. BG0011 TaxID=2082950 RepID=UPI000D1F693B|nr:restriction endonuclease subunit S [Cyanothece sp. BG0011]
MVSFPKYDSYKDSGVEWLGDIPSHWEVIKNKYLGTIVNGSTPSSSIPRYWDGDIVWITPNDLGKLNSTYIYDSERKITNDGLKSCGTHITPINSIIISSRAPIGHLAITKVPSCINQGCKIIVPNLSKIDPRFTYYFLLTFNLYIKSLGKGTTFCELSSYDLKSLKVLNPPIQEQQKIAKFLDEKTAEIDEAISYKQRLIELLQEQKAILINQAVTKGLNPNVPMRYSGIEWLGDIPEHWEVKRAKYLLKEIDERSQTGKEELLSVSHLTGVTPRSEKNVTMFMAEDYTGSKTCQKDDLVINIMWAWMGALGVSDRTGIISSSYAVFRQYNSKAFDSWYLENLLRSTAYIAQYNKLSTGLRASRLRLYSDVFLRLPLKIPPRKEQEKIKVVVTEKLKNIDRIINQIQQQIEKLKELKQILISNAVTGKIKVL